MIKKKISLTAAITDYLRILDNKKSFSKTTHNGVTVFLEIVRYFMFYRLFTLIRRMIVYCTLYYFEIKLIPLNIFNSQI